MEEMGAEKYVEQYGERKKASKDTEMLKVWLRGYREGSAAGRRNQDAVNHVIASSLNQYNALRTILSVSDFVSYRKLSVHFT